jgi:hypothetical protein
MGRQLGVGGHRIGSLWPVGVMRVRLVLAESENFACELWE